LTVELPIKTEGAVDFLAAGGRLYHLLFPSAFLLHPVFSVTAQPVLAALKLDSVHQKGVSAAFFRSQRRQTNGAPRSRLQR